MYYQDDREQLSIEEFFQPFGGRLRKDNRWVKLAEIMPWEYIKKVYIVNANQKMSIFAEKGCHFSPDSIQVYTALTATSLVGLKPVKP